MKKSKIVSFVLTFAMLASMAVPAMAAEAEIMPISATATEGHWSDAAMGRWAEVGVFKGDQYGDFMPDKEMTRAEFAQVLVNLMGYTEVAENTYADIPADAWYADAMLKLVAAGVLKGTGYNEVGAIVSPNAPISREQTAVLLCRALSLKPSADAKIDFPDASSVSDWAKDAVAALTERGMLKGTGDGNVSPALVIDRGSVAQMVSNMVSEYVTKDGAEVTGEQKGIVIVAAKEVTFQNAKLAETVVVAPKAARASVTFTGNTTAAEVVVSAEGAAVTVGKTAKVESVTLDAAKAAVTVNGTVTNVTVNENAANADVTANQGAKIGTVATAAAGTDITGAKNTIGTIVAEATATDVKVAASGAKIENKSAETVGKVAPGATGKAPSSGSAVIDGGSSSSSHTGTYAITNDVDADKGSVSVKVGGREATSANAGETVTVTVTAKTGYKVTKVYAVNKDTNVKFDGTVNAEGKSGTVTFTMPAAVKGVVVSATFEAAPVEPEKPTEDTYVITKDVDATKGNVSVKVGGREVTKASAGEIVTITATANSGYKVTEVYAVTPDTGVKIASTTTKNEISFQMPKIKVVVRVGFEAASEEPAGPEDQKFDATKLSGNNNEVLSSLNSDFFTANGTVKAKWKNGDTPGVVSVELNKGSSIGFTPTASATVVVEVSSTKDGQTSTCQLLDANGTPVADSEGEATVTVTGGASGKKSVTYTVEAGAYKVFCPTDSANGARIYTITVTF